ncbi:hypothetical protein BGW37DRAFT_515027 [Umbelopsis sp. PMI_123]|nr:hypothetical protein BGW37DRAFT_515027 [Umbelopsis sp. PMI_123]
MVNLDPPPDTTRLMSHLRRSQSHPDQPKPSKGTNSSNLSHVPCKFWKQGTCTAGANCIFSHNLDTTSESSVCKYFLKGNCKFGTKCALLHTLSPQAPDARKLLNTRSNAAALSRSLGTSSQQHIPSSMRTGLLDLNSFTSNTRPSPDLSPFARIPIDSGPSSNNDRYSQLSANIHQNFLGSSAPSTVNNSHFRLGQSPNSMDGHLSPTDTSFSPFSGRRGLYMPQHQTPQYTALSPRTASLSKLNGIPERENDYFEIDQLEEDMSNLLQDLGGTEESMLPSSLNDLLTPSELQSRRAREQREGLSNTPSGTTLSRSLRSYSGSKETIPVSPSLNGDQRTYRTSSSPLSATTNGTQPWSVPFYQNVGSSRGSPKVSAIEDSPQLSADQSDLSSSISNAINIPGGGGSKQHIASIHTNRRPAYSKGFDEADPFDPFASGVDDDVQFYMEEDETVEVGPGTSIMPNIQARISDELRRPN